MPLSRTHATMTAVSVPATSHATHGDGLTLESVAAEMRYAKDWSPASQRWYQPRLNRFIAWANAHGVHTIDAVTAPLVRRYLDELRATPNQRTGEPLDSYTVHGHARAVRTLLFFAASEDLLDDRIPRRIALPKREQKVLRILSDEQLERLFTEARRTPTPLRDTALLSLLLDGGLRAGELCSLRLDDVTFEPDSAWLFVRKAKGRRQREVGLGKKARYALYRYIHRERHAPANESALFIGEKGPLQSEGLDRLLYRLRDAAGAEHFAGVSVGAHRWRHTHAVRAIEAGADLYTVSRGMGHSSVQVTEGYLKAVSQRRLRQLAISPLDTL